MAGTVSSRIFVRNLPPSLTDTEFRAHFSQTHQVTDAKFIGHRRIGYVGYKTAEDAASAVKYFNKSFIRMSKIFVELARPVSSTSRLFTSQMFNITKITDDSLPNRARVPWNNATGHADSFPAASASEVETTETQKSLKRKRDVPRDENTDPKLKEFLGVMQRPSQHKSWVNEAIDGVDGDTSPEEGAEVNVNMEEESEGEYQTISKKSKTKREGKLSIPQSEPVAKLPPPVENVTGPGEEPDGPREGQTDADWLRSKTSRLLGLVDEEEEERHLPVSKPIDEDTGSETSEKFTTNATIEKTNPEDVEHNEESETPVNADEEAIRKSCRLFLRNLPYTITEDDVNEHFAGIGNLEEVRLFCNSRVSPFRDDHLIGTSYASVNDVIRKSILVDASHI
jgi:multiple RNA-binding domain-containing protein 1